MVQLIPLSPFLALPSHTPALDAIVQIHRAQAGFSLVVDQHLVGIFTEKHVFQALATGKNLATLPLSAVMTPSPIALQDAEANNLALIVQHFQRHQLQYLPVINNQNQPVGVISHYAVLAALQAQLEQDAVERQQTALQCRTQFTRLFLDANPNLMMRLARDGTYLDFIPAKGFKSFVPDTDILGKNIFQVMPAAFAQERMRYVERTLQTGTPQVYEHEMEVEGDRRYQEAQVSVSGEDEVLIVVRDITDRKRAEAERKQVETALQEKEEQLRLALNFTHTGIWHWHIHDDRLLWNENTARLMGLSPDQLEVNVDTWSACVHPEDLPRVCQDEDYALENHTSHNVEYRVIWPDGTVRWMLVKGHGIYDETGQAVRMVGVVMDITDRKQMEAAFQQSEQCYRAIVEDQTELIVRSRADTTLTFANEAYCRYFGVKREEIIGESYQPVIVLDDREHVDQLIRSLSVENPVVMIESRVIAANGDIRWTQWINRVILDDQNRIVELQSVGRDITDRKQIEIALQESEEKFRQLAAHIQDVFWILSPSDFLCVYVSPAFEKVWGHSCEALYCNRQIFIDSIHPDDRVRVWNTITERNQHGGKSDIEYRIVKPDGEIRWIHDRGNSICNELGQVYRVVGIASDITDRKRAEEALQQAKETAEAANRAKSEFLSRMSHELRTPLTSVLGFADLIARDPSLNPEHQEHLAIIHRSGTHLLNLINSVLEMSKIEAGELTLHETRFDLHRLLKTVKDLFQLKAMSKGLTLSVTWDLNLPQHIQTDENKLRQVLINLLDNAIKFTETGRVALRVSRGQRAEGRGQKAEGEMKRWGDGEVGRTFQSSVHRKAEASYSPQPSILSLHFQVADTGAGIAPEELAILFDAFIQTEAGRKLQQGTGLGLAISRQFVRLMGGEITVESQLGQGTTLDFEIRVSAQSATPSPVMPQQITHLAVATTYRILIADDQPETRKMLVELLEPIGFQVQEAADGEETVILWQTWQPHLIWMDIHMPVMNGHRATQAIRARERQGSREVPTKIIALTADVFEPQRSSALAAGCDDFVVKPFQPMDILQKIAEHLNVQYLNAADQLPEAAPCPEASGFPAASAVLPATWNADLRGAALRLHAKQCLELIEQLPATYSPLAQTLTDCVNRFQFGAIVDWVEQAGDR